LPQLLAEFRVSGTLDIKDMPHLTAIVMMTKQLHRQLRITAVCCIVASVTLIVVAVKTVIVVIGLALKTVAVVIVVAVKAMIVVLIVGVMAVIVVIVVALKTVVVVIVVAVKAVIVVRVVAVKAVIVVIVVAARAVIVVMAEFWSVALCTLMTDTGVLSLKMNISDSTETLVTFVPEYAV
jgi:hypothetical protein